MRPPQERAANENRLEFRDPRRNTGKGYSCVHGKVIIISAEVKHSGGSAFHLFRLGACEGGGVGGLLRRAWWVTFSEGSQGRRRAIKRRPEPVARAPALRLLALCPVLRKPFCQGQALSGAVRGCTSPLQGPGADGGEKGGGEALAPEGKNRSRVELREIRRKARASGFWTVLPPLRIY